jgi:predicted AAA+ superfamily ATPase
MEYLSRHIDLLIPRQLEAMGAFLIRGPKGCGKTETARRFAQSEIVIDDVGGDAALHARSLFADIISNRKIESSLIEPDLKALYERMVIGGWSGNLSLDEEQAMVANDNALGLLCEVDVSRVDKARKDPLKVRQLIRSLARNISTKASFNTIKERCMGQTVRPFDRYDDQLSRSPGTLDDG